MPVWKHPSSPLRENFVSIGMKVFFLKIQQFPTCFILCWKLKVNCKLRWRYYKEIESKCIRPYSHFSWNVFFAQVREGIHVTQGVVILRSLKTASWVWKEAKKAGTAFYFFPSKFQLAMFSLVGTVFEWYFVDHSRTFLPSGCLLCSGEIWGAIGFLNPQINCCDIA